VNNVGVLELSTDAASVYVGGGSLDLDLTSVDSSIPSVVPAPALDGAGVDFLGSLSQMGDNLLRSPTQSSSLSGHSSDRQSSAAAAESATASTDCPPADGHQDAEPSRGPSAAPASPQPAAVGPLRGPVAPASPQPAAVEPSSSAGDADTQTTPPGGEAAAAAGDTRAKSASKTSSSEGADVDSIEFACNLTFDTTDLIDAGARHEVIDVTNALATCQTALAHAMQAVLFSSVL